MRATAIASRRSLFFAARTIEPNGLVCRGDAWWLVAWWRLRKAARAFRIDAITSWKAGAVFPPREGSSFDETEMWNGKPELARELAAPSFALHLPTPGNVDRTTVTTPDAVVAWVAASIARFDAVTFRYEAGPFVDTVAGIVAGPWSAAIIAGGWTQRLAG